jgi:membrane protease YdiL (CAAX protease family)
MFGLVLSTLLFSFAHGFPDSIALLPLAAILGYTYLQRRSYRTVVLVHLIFNGFNMTLAALEMWQ